MPSRESRLSRLLVLLVAVAAALAVFACQGKSTVTGPSSTMAGANVSGSWAGAFESDNVMTCGNSVAAATLQQVGNEVTGNLSTSDCGVGGYFKGTISGNTINGAVSMTGCVGGEFSGTVNANRISINVGDMTKPLITGDRVIIAGGVLTLTR